MQTSGTLDKQGLGYTLMRLVSREEPVLLTVKTGARTYTLFIDSRGMRLDRVEESFAVPFEDVLLEEGHLTEINLLRCLTSVLESKKPIEDAVVRAKVLPSEVVRNLKTRQTERELLRLFAVTEGTYEIVPADPAAAEKDRDESIPAFYADMSRMASTALEDARQFDGIAAEARNDREFFRAKPDLPPDVTWGSPEEAQSKLLRAMRGDKPLCEVIKDLELPAFKVFGLVDKFLKAGWVAPLSLPELREGAEAAFNRGEPAVALAYLRRAFEKDRLDPQVAGGLATLFESAGESAPAAAFLEYLAALEDKAGEHGKAAEAMERTVAIAPSDLRLRNKLVAALLRAGERSKAREAGLLLADEASKAGDGETARRTFGTLLQEFPEDLDLRYRMLDVKASQGDLEGARSELNNMKMLAGSGPGAGADMLLLSRAAKRLAGSAPEEGAGPAAAGVAPSPAVGESQPPAKPRGIPRAAVLGAVLALAAAAAGWWFFLGPGAGVGAGGGGSPGTPGGGAAPLDPAAVFAKRQRLLEEAEKRLKEGDLAVAEVKFREALRGAPADDPLSRRVREGQGAVAKAREVQAQEKAAAALREIARRAQDAEARGKNAPEKELEEVLAALRGLLAELDAFAAKCPPALHDASEEEKGKASGVILRLEGRLQELVYLRGAISWEKTYSDIDGVRKTLRRAAETGPRQDIRDKARDLDAAIGKYLEEADLAFRRASEALEKTLTAEGETRDALFLEALILLKSVALDHPRSPHASGVRFPLWVETTPEGAILRVEGRAEEARTPSLVLYAPAEGARILVEKPGYLPVSLTADGNEAVSRFVLKRQFLWTVKTADAVDRGPAVAGGRAFVSCRDGGLYAISWPDGKPVRAWPPFRVNDIGGIKATPAVWSGRVVFCPATLGQVLALDAATGEPAWEPLPTTRMVDHRPCGVEGTPVVLVGDLGGILYAVNVQTGRIAWELPLGDEGEGIRSAPVVFPARGWAFVGTTRGALVKIDFRNGRKIWKIPTGLGVNVSPVAAGDTVLAAVGSRLLAFDPAPRDPPEKPRWAATMLTEIAPPAAQHGLVHVAERGGTYRVLRLADGKETLSAPLGQSQPAAVTPLPLEKSVVVASGNLLLAFDIREGKAEVLWTLETPGPVNDPLIVSDGVLFLTTAGGVLCATLAE